MKLVRAFSIAMTISALPLVAQAADFPGAVAVDPIYQPTPAHSWTGGYIGVHTGYGLGNSSIRNEHNNSDIDPVDEGLGYIRDNCLNMSDAAIVDLENYNGGSFWNDAENLGDWCAPPLDMSSKPEGLVGGMQAGYDMQFSNFVLGVVGDAALTGIDGTFDNDIERGPTTYNIFEVSYDWMATLRARAGWLVTPQALVYGHGGVAFADISIENLNPNANGSLGDIHYDNVEVGGVIGVGAEYAVTSNISLFLEYSFIDFGDYEGNFTFDPYWDSDDGEGTREEANEGSFGGSNSLNLIKFGANYRFN